MFDLFLKAVEQYGLPSRVRGDHGVEKMDVPRFMLSHHREDPIVAVLSLAKVATIKGLSVYGGISLQDVRHSSTIRLCTSKNMVT